MRGTASGVERMFDGGGGGGTAGAGSATVVGPALYNSLLGTRFKVIQGYRSSTEVLLAMSRGEIEGYSGHPWASLVAAAPDFGTHDAQQALLSGRKQSRTRACGRIDEGPKPIAQLRRDQTSFWLYTPTRKFYRIRGPEYARL